MLKEKDKTTASNKALGEHLKYLRRLKGYTQKEVAECLRVDQTTISSWERDRTSPSIYQLQRLAELFETSIDSFFRPEREDIDRWNILNYERAIANYVVQLVEGHSISIFLDHGHIALAVVHAILSQQKEKMGFDLRVFTNSMAIYRLWRAAAKRSSSYFQLQLELIGGQYFDSLDALFTLTPNLPEKLDMSVIEVDALAFSENKNSGMYCDSDSESEIQMKQAFLKYPTKHLIVACPPTGGSPERKRKGGFGVSKGHKISDFNSSLLEYADTCTILTAWPQEQIYDDNVNSQLTNFESLSLFTTSKGEDLRLLIFDKERKNYSEYGGLVARLSREIQEAKQQGDNQQLLTKLIAKAHVVAKQNKPDDAKKLADEALSLAEGIDCPSGEVWEELGDVYYSLAHQQDIELAKTTLRCYEKAEALYKGSGDNDAVDRIVWKCTMTGASSIMPP